VANKTIFIMCLAGIMAVSPVTSAFAESCTTSTCHQAIAGLQYQHSPVKDSECLSCHKQISKEHPAKGTKSFELTASGAALCAQCHEAMGKKKEVHAPVKEGECLACHKPHGAANRFLLEVGEDQRVLCFSCHDSARFNENYQHGPAAVGACTKCHDPHESNEKYLSRIPARERCLKCHADFGKSLNEAKVVHAPVQLNQCYSCHNPHGAALPNLVTKKMPDLCIYCHKKVGEKMVNAKVPHKPLLQEGGCGTCHSAHFANSKGLLAADEMTVCLNCHGKDNLGTPPLKNIKREISSRKYLHGPLLKGQCKACHDPHGSNYFRMLRGSYPRELYVPYKEGEYSACLGCHDKNLLRFEETSLYTKFRNGKRNLHYVHVSNTRKGRSCRICHEPHASDGLRLINKKGYQFGDWNIPINFVVTPSGGSCAPGCHRAFAYDREKPVAY
jgi:predicted CXXCH cytochrome family protein